MPMSLERWQDRLEKHFASLATARVVSGLPLFALEHGLSDDELEEIKGPLHSRLAAGMSLSPHWLVWVVYATERGYDYDGEEYWRSFEERTPHWDNSNRSQLRAWFSKFKKIYQGVEPSGPWADFFKIIAWPITHAILPKYLQRQFAKALYDIRYRLVGMRMLGNMEVGRLLAANTWNASSRFREFLQQEELAGRIALALISDQVGEGQDPIYTPALRRIVSDLERVGSAREWLKDTRGIVTDQFKGTGRSSRSAPALRQGVQIGQRDFDDAGMRIRPTLLLRPSGATAWSVVIEVPNFDVIARIEPDIRAFLGNTRCRIAGAGDAWMPTGWLLSSVRKCVLRTWPDMTKPLVMLERQHSTINHLLDSECRLTPGPIWLCRIGSDNVAKEVVGRIIRPGHRYIILSKERLPSDHHFVTPCSVDCSGIDAGLLELPEALSSESIEWLQRLGLQVARTIRIWPAGLSGRGWDSEGYSEWLTTEAPCFGIVHDHQLDAYSLRLNDGVETVIKAGAVGHPVFVSIPCLSAGRHTLSIKARRSALSPALPPSPPTEGLVTLEVREPRPWISGTTSHAGLAVTVDPFDPTLDMFWQGNVGVAILGPEGRQVTCHIQLTSVDGTELLSEEIGTFHLPVTESTWQVRLEQFVKNERWTWAYLEAVAGHFVIRGDELGEYGIRLERKVKPVRWVCQSAQRKGIIRLIDDTGQDDAAKCHFYSLRCPTESKPVEIKAALAGFMVEPPGGLFIAQQGEHSDVIVVSSPQIMGGFQGLGIEPDLNDLKHGPIQIRRILRILRLWIDARLVGPLVEIRRDHVTRAILQCLYSRLLGNRWAEAEAAYLLRPGSDAALQQLERSVGGPPNFAIVLRREHDSVGAGTVPPVKWFAELATRYHVSSERRLCEFALRLASQPHRLSSVFGGELDGWFRRVTDKTVLLRGARFLALLAITKNPKRDGAVIPRWQWQ